MIKKSSNSRDVIDGNVYDITVMDIVYFVFSHSYFITITVHNITIT